jgi:peptidoglycan/LPS O-acetylase OafA/YrhL
MKMPAHMPALDGLRGLAILLVIAHNAQLLETPEMHGATKFVVYLMGQGWVGVQLFFVLSGFLITGILLDTTGRAGALRTFIVRRALRIFPLYYGALFLIFAVLPAIGMQPDIYRAQAPYQGWLWAYLSNWTDPMGIGPKALGHFWSLAVEEQFYLFWPLVVFALGSPVRVAWAAVVIAIASLVSREWLLYANVHADVVYSWTICRIDALVLGGFAAACWRIPAWSAWVRQHATKLAIGGLVMMAGEFIWTHGFPRLGPHNLTVGYSALAIFFAGLIYLAAWTDHHPRAGQQPWWHRTLTLPVLRNIGKYSYGMYVIHKPLHDLFSVPALKALGISTEGMPLQASLHVAVVMLVSYAAAWLSYHLYEVHFLNLKRHFEPRGNPAVPATA